MMDWPTIHQWLFAPAPAWLVLAVGVVMVVMVLGLRSRIAEVRRILVGFLRTKAREEKRDR